MKARTLLLLLFLISSDLLVQAQSVIRGPYLQMATPNSITVRWRTSDSTNSRVNLGDTINNLITAYDSTTLKVDHEVRITGLSTATKYYYSVGTTDTVLIGNDSMHYFVTSPSVGSKKSIRAWIIGDSGTKDFKARNVRDAYYGYRGDRHADLWLMLGDNAYYDGTDAEYQNAVFYDMYEDMLTRKVLWTTPGNHDYGSGASAATQTGPYYDIFTLPKNAEAGGLASGTEAYYSFDHGNVHFISMDSHDSPRDTNGTMLTWLQNDLAATNQDWIIAFWHHPPYSKGHDSDSEQRLIDMRENAVPILEAAGVDLVLSGHSHSYERSHLLHGHYGLSNTLTSEMILDNGDGRPDYDCAYTKVTNGATPNKGAVYVVAGSSGKVDNTGWHPIMYTMYNKLGSVILDVEDNRLELQFITDQAILHDDFTIYKDVNLTYEESLCQGDSITLTASWKGDGYVWTPGGDTTRSITVAPTDTTLYIVDDIYGCLKDSITVNYIPYSLAVDFGNDTTLCLGDSLVLDATNTNVTYSWQDASSNATYTVTGPGTYWVNVRNLCGTDSIIDSIVVNYTPALQVDLGNDTTLCTGDSLSLDASNSGASYLWKDGSTNAALNITQAGTYWVEVSNLCDTLRDTITVSYTPLIQVALGNDTSLCSGDSLILDATNSNVSYLWQDNSTNATYTAKQSGTYSVSVSNSCETVTDSIAINYIPALQVDLGTDTVLCTGDSLMLDVSNSGASYLWKDGSTNATLNITQAGTYWVEVSSLCDTLHDTITVSYTPLIQVALGNDTSLCPGDSLILDATNNNVTYLWQDNSTNATYTVQQSGTYKVSVSNTCETVTDSMVVTYLTLPTVNLGNDTTICPGDSLILDATNPNSTYLWQDNSTQATFTAKYKGVYWVRVINDCDTVSDTLTIDSCFTTHYLYEQGFSSNLYPNPSDGLFTLALNTPRPVNFLVQDLLGNQVIFRKQMNSGKYTFDISHLVEGIYLYELSDQEGRLINKGKLITN